MGWTGSVWALLPSGAAALATWSPAHMDAAWLPYCAAGEFLCALSFLLHFAPPLLMNVSEAVWTWIWKGQRRGRSVGMDTSCRRWASGQWLVHLRHRLCLSPPSQRIQLRLTIPTRWSHIWPFAVHTHTPIDSPQFPSQFWPMQEMHQWLWHQHPVVPHNSDPQDNIQGTGTVDSPPGPHLCADSASSEDLVGKTPVGIVWSLFWAVPWRFPASQAVVAYRDSMIYNSHPLPYWYFLGSHAK